MSEISVRRATLDDYPELIKLIDLSFFPNPAQGFCEFLPNLYCDPKIATQQAYLACDGDKLIGHVGVYPLRLRLRPGVELSAGGVGAVATHPDHRGCGAMSQLLKAASAGMAEQGYDISVLWGNRMRYARWGYDQVGRRLEWCFDPRLAQQLGATAISMVPFDPSQHINPLIEAWNFDLCGTLHDAKTLAGLMSRKKWNTLVVAETTSGPLPFATYQMTGNRIIVDKMIGPDELLPGMLLHLHQMLGGGNDQIFVRCPPLNHPVAQLALKTTSGLSQTAACQARVINVASVARKMSIDQHILEKLDPCALSRFLFGTPAEAVGNGFNLWIEETAYV